MQTFLPYADFARSASTLSDGRGGHLNNQRNEALIVLRSCIGGVLGGWPNHAVTRMWMGHEHHLFLYIVALQEECMRRGIAGSAAFVKAETLSSQFKLEKKRPLPPPWLGDKAFHRSHKSNLVRKNPDHYRKFFPNVPDDLDYIYPRGNGAP